MGMKEGSPRTSMLVVSEFIGCSPSIRWNKSSEWVSSTLLANVDWKRMAEPVMQLYTERTDESKESALVWNHQDADPDFGTFQAKELLDHLENVMENELVEVKRGQYTVEVKPQGVNKGLVVKNLFSSMVSNWNPPDYVMCIGDDRSDEDMFESIMCASCNPLLPAVPESISHYCTQD